MSIVYEATKANSSIPPGARKTRHLPGEVGVWVFIIGDLLAFACFFIAFAYYRSLDVSLYNASQGKLSEIAGLVNTLFLLTSSLFVAAAVKSARSGRNPAPSAAIIAAIVCGLAFLGIKVWEYIVKFEAGINIRSDGFFMFYFVLTGIHMLHVMIGLGVLSYFASKAREGFRSENEIRDLECGGAYWHMVDLLWVVLFALLYLAR